MKVTILGTRGIPARYGGFETFAEELGVRLAARGHEVTVYGRRRFGEAAAERSEYRGVRLRYSPTFFHKYLETPVSALMSLLAQLRERPEAILLCNAANSPFAWIPRVAGIPIAINVDGIERHRSKWNRLGKLWYLLGERCSVLFGSRVIADAHVIADYYRARFRANPEIITYGAVAHDVPPGDTLQKFGLEPGRYLLYVSRFEPENNALGVIEAYRKVPEAHRIPLVMVGDAPYATEYKKALEASAVPGVVFTGYQFGPAYQELRKHCYCYVQATEVGGTHPALVEAMAYGNCVIANATPENLEVLGGAGLYYWRNDFTDLAARLTYVLQNPARAKEYGREAAKRAAERYSWDVITEQYERLFLRLASR